MPPKNPSFLIKSRHGIWYFQYWKPKSRKSSRKLIRKSLKTRNRTNALQLARRMWVSIQDNGVEIFMAADELKRADEQRELDKQKYDVGARVAAEIKKLGINPENEFAIESFFENTPPHWEKGYYFYLAYQQQLTDKKSVVTAENALPPPTSAEPLESHQSLPSRNNPLIVDVLNQWLDSVASNMKASSLPEYKRMTKQFLKSVREFHNGREPRLNDLTEEAIRDYRDTIERLPKGAKTKGKNIHQIASKGGIRKSPQTINGIFANVSLFISWLEKKGFDVPPKVLRMLSLKLKVSPEDKKKRQALDWTSHDNQTLRTLKMRHVHTPRG